MRYSVHRWAILLILFFWFVRVWAVDATTDSLAHKIAQPLRAEEDVAMINKVGCLGAVTSSLDLSTKTSKGIVNKDVAKVVFESEATNLIAFQRNGARQCPYPANLTMAESGDGKEVYRVAIQDTVPDKWRLTKEIFGLGRASTSSGDGSFRTLRLTLTCDTGRKNCQATEFDGNIPLNNLMKCTQLSKEDAHESIDKLLWREFYDESVPAKPAKAWVDAQKACEFNEAYKNAAAEKSGKLVGTSLSDADAGPPD